MLDYFLDPSQLQVSIDLNRASAGFKRYSISAKNIKLPVGLQIAGTNPAHIELNLRKKPGTPEGTG
ncbi:MAG: hypothetical protein ACREIZ_01375, partial [Candidatus Methylomirabilales bacterium]